MLRVHVLPVVLFAAQVARGNLVPMNLQDAEKLNVERRERSDVRKLIGDHAAQRREAEQEGQVDGAPLDGRGLDKQGSLDGGGSLASETSTLTAMTKRTFAAANVHVDRGQQRSLTRAAKGEGFLERPHATRLPPSTTATASSHANTETSVHDAASTPRPPRPRQSLKCGGAVACGCALIQRRKQYPKK